MSDIAKRLLAGKSCPQEAGDLMREAADRISTQRVIIDSYAASCKAAAAEIAMLKERLAAAEAEVARHKHGGCDGKEALVPA